MHRASPAQLSFQDPIPSAYIASTNFADTTVARTDLEHTGLASIQVLSTNIVDVTQPFNISHKVPAIYNILILLTVYRDLERV